MGPVGSRLTFDPPSGEGPPSKPGHHWRALAIVTVVLVVICGMIAWSQWYAIHVNVPMYEARHSGATSH